MEEEKNMEKGVKARAMAEADIEEDPEERSTCAKKKKAEEFMLH